MLGWAVSLALRFYFVRVPVLAWLVLLLLGPCGYLYGSEFASGLLYCTEASKLVLVSAVAFIASAACLGSFNLIRVGAPQRFHLNLPIECNVVFIALAHAAPLSLIATISLVSMRHGSGEPLYGYVLAALGGYVIAVFIVVLSRVLQLLFTASAGSAPLDMFFPGRDLNNWEKWWKREEWSWVGWIKKAAFAAFSLVTAVTAPVFKEGYDDDPKQPLGIAAGHVYAAALGILSFVLYFALGISRQVQIEHSSLGQPTRLLATAAEWLFSHILPFSVLDPANIPALGWVLFFFTMAVWILSGASYCIDRWRIPMLAPAIALIIVTGGSPETDHYYRTDERPQAWHRPSAAQILERRKSAGRKLILLSAPGGGIQSTAWTAWVISELEAASKGQFMKNVAVMSGVSGGSVGLFHLAAADFDPKAAFENAKKPAIDDVAWGYMVPDVGRMFNPWVRNRAVDRGWALEKALSANAGLKNDLFIDSPALTPNEDRPSLIMNATIMETGEPLVFSTSAFVDEPAAPMPVCGPRETTGGLQDFSLLYRRKIRLVTAARLSASFPYVSPGSRTLDRQPLCADYHLLDGGYYDNYGIYSLAQWLHSADLGRQFDQILLVRLFAFPYRHKPPSAVGWRAQFTIPAQGVLNARESSQDIVARSFVDLLRDTLPEDVKLTTAVFRYQGKEKVCGDPPLNWVLTQRQIDCIDRERTSREFQEASNQVLDFLGAAKQQGQP